MIADINSWAFRPSLYGAFQLALTDRLAACGVQSRIWYLNPKATDDAERFRNDLGSYAPSAVIEIADSEGTRLTMISISSARR